MATLRVKKDRKLGPVAKLLRRKGWRTPVRVKSHSHGFLEGDVFLCIARKDSVDAIPIDVGFSTSNVGALSAKEKTALRRVGLKHADSKVVEESIKDSTKAYLALLVESFSVEQAATRLKVNESRVRQRLCAHPPSLFGIKLVDGWRLPKCQFVEDGEVPGLGEVVSAFDVALDPISFCSWFTSPNTDLVLEDGGAKWSPRDWLRGRHPAEAVLRLAKSL